MIELGDFFCVMDVSLNPSRNECPTNSYIFIARLLHGLESFVRSNFRQRYTEISYCPLKTILCLHAMVVHKFLEATHA